MAMVIMAMIVCIILIKSARSNSSDNNNFDGADDSNNINNNNTSNKDDKSNNGISMKLQQDLFIPMLIGYGLLSSIGGYSAARGSSYLYCFVAFTRSGLG